MLSTLHTIVPLACVAAAAAVLPLNSDDFNTFLDSLKKDGTTMKVRSILYAVAAHVSMT
jgi:hypothetical protein